MDRDKINKLRQDAEVIEWDFATASGNTIREKVVELAGIIKKFNITDIVGGAECIALAEIAGCKQTMIKDAIYPTEELLLIGPNNKLIKIKNFL